VQEPVTSNYDAFHTHTHTLNAFPCNLHIRSRPTIFLHFPKGTYSIKVKETTLLVEFVSVDSVLYSYRCVMPGSVAKTPKEG
jgi:hypothetical protein